jgi:anti-anti-sigma regulatory factor
VQQAAKQLESTGGEVFLDFSSVRRIDSSSLRAIEELASTAEQKDVKVVLRGVSVDVYKVLKLMKLASRFSFVH